MEQKGIAFFGGDPQLIVGILTLAEQQRLQGNLQNTHNLLAPLAEIKTDHALVQFEMGLIYDAMSKEAEAIPFKKER